MNKELRNETERELKKWPGVTWEEEDGGRHTKVTLHYKGESRLVIASKTPSDVRAVPNHLAVLRREMRAMGATQKHVPVGTPKPANPVLRKAPKPKEEPVAKESKQDLIFKTIGDLRYSEMLEFAGFLRDVATVENLRRGDKRSWAATLQVAVETHRDSDTSLAENGNAG